MLSPLVRRTALSLMLFATAIPLAACSDDDGGEQGSESDAVVPEGQYLFTLSVEALSGLELPFQFDVVAAADGRSISSLTVRATRADAEVSDELGTLEDIPVNEDGTFTFSLEGLMIPGDFIPTGSTVEVDMVAAATVNDDGTFCGDVSGEVVSLSLSLDGSTFGTKEWDGAIDGPSSCDSDGGDALPRLSPEECPTLEEGTNDSFDSAGETRSFEVVLPETVNSETPVLFLFHGFGGNGKEFLDAGGEDLATSLDAIVIAPDGLEQNGLSSWDTFNEAATNRDVAFFDDLLTCAKEAWSASPAAVWATGMSFGGLMTGTLMVSRADELTAVVPMSGGFSSGDFSEDACLPSLVIWGGESDEAFDQDFDQLSREMISELSGGDSPVVACDHGGGHTVAPYAFDAIATFFMEYGPDASCEAPSEELLAALPGDCALPE